MASRILDTNVLIGRWHRCRKGRKIEDCTLTDAREWGRRISMDGDIILPVRIEFLVCAKTEHECRLYEEYLRQFGEADNRRILAVDWEVAESIAKGIRKPRPARGRGIVSRRTTARDFGDCLIRAVCRRLRREIVIDDREFPSH